MENLPQSQLYLLMLSVVGLFSSGIFMFETNVTGAVVVF